MHAAHKEGQRNTHKSLKTKHNKPTQSGVQVEVGAEVGRKGVHIILY